MRDYQLIEHTADIGIRVKAKDLQGIFANTALAMFDIISERKKTGGAQKEKISITQQADSLDELFVNWLNELLSLSATKELIFSGFIINKIDQKHIEAEVLGEELVNFKVNTEIKAATYHQLKIEQIKSGWQVEVIFDV